MKIFNSLEEVRDYRKKPLRLATLTVFERSGNNKRIRRAQECKFKSAAFTFSNHTRTLLKNMLREKYTVC